MRSIIFVTLIALMSCSEPCTNVPEFKKGDEVVFKASSFGKKAVITNIEQGPDCQFYYEVTYFTLWDTRRVKIVSPYEIEKR